ncbi:TatD family hydrolase [Myxococcota bacterium]|nr:TatD family hydrolase [Myxococcota bacterium]
MRIFDPHTHMSARTTDDYERMAMAGYAGIIEPAFWMGQPRTHVATFKDYYDSLLGWERFRAAQFGIRHYCTMGLNPKEANDTRVNDAVLELLSTYIHKEGVVGIGEIGYDDMTDEEHRCFKAQIQLAKDSHKPILIHTPHRDKKQGVIRSLELAAEVGLPENLTLMDHNTEETIGLVKETACWAGFTIYPNTKLTPERVVALFERFGTDKMLINSSADWGISDPLMVARTVMLMRKVGMDEEEIEKVVWRNPIEFFAQSGQISFADFDAHGPIDRTLKHEGNTVLRGQKP